MDISECTGCYVLISSVVNCDTGYDSRSIVHLTTNQLVMYIYGMEKCDNYVRTVCKTGSKLVIDNAVTCPLYCTYLMSAWCT